MLLSSRRRSWLSGVVELTDVLVGCEELVKVSGCTESVVELSDSAELAEAVVFDRIKLSTIGGGGRGGGIN